MDCQLKATAELLLQLVSKHGWTGLYRGLEPALLGTAVSQGVYFYLYSWLRGTAVARLQAKQNTKSEDIGVGASLMVAALAGAGNVLLTTPIWTISTRMQVCISSHSIQNCWADDHAHAISEHASLPGAGTRTVTIGIAYIATKSSCSWHCSLDQFHILICIAFWSVLLHFMLHAVAGVSKT